MPPLKRIIENYGLTLLLGALWITNWIGFAFTLWIEPGPMDWRTFWEGTLENNQSEYLQLFSFVLFSTWFVHRNSPQSRDGDDRRDEQLERMEKMLAALMRERAHDRGLGEDTGRSV